MQNPPVVLVKTWLQLLQSDIEREVKREVEDKILNFFGSIEVAIVYLQDSSDAGN
jgi:hypothetical protein